jgi:hypothetical protein
MPCLSEIPPKIYQQDVEFVLNRTVEHVAVGKVFETYANYGSRMSVHITARSPGGVWKVRVVQLWAGIKKAGKSHEARLLKHC